jgi:hypothetical protein
MMDKNLRRRVTAALTDHGFIEGSKNSPGRSVFYITEGGGIGLSKFWAHAPEAARSQQLASIAYTLREAGIEVPVGDDFLYVPGLGGSA